MKDMKNMNNANNTNNTDNTDNTDNTNSIREKKARMPFHSLAHCYDVLNYNADYKKIADYAEDVFALYNIKPELVLDLACGTGNLTIELDRRGYDMIGLDSSCDMLSVASTKKRKRKSLAQVNNRGVLWTNQDMTDFELYGTVDAVICSLDSINYILESDSLKRCFKLVYNYLNWGGVFIFDVNSKYKFENIYDRHDFVLKGEDTFGAWESYYNKKTKLCSFEITLFIQDWGTEKEKESSNGESSERYIRRTEIQYERYYSTKFLTELLQDCNFRDINIFSDFDINSVINTDKSNKTNSRATKVERICFSCVKKQ